MNTPMGLWVIESKVHEKYKTLLSRQTWQIRRSRKMGKDSSKLVENCEPCLWGIMVWGAFCMVYCWTNGPHNF